MDGIDIREFIYLDIERMKSLYAQTQKGLTETETEGKNTDKKASGNVGTGGILKGLGIDAGAMGEILVSNQKTETKTLHDYMYNRIEKVLKSKKLLLKIGFDEEFDAEIFENWKKGELDKSIKIHDKPFVLVKGRVMIEDYHNLNHMVQKINELQVAGRVIIKGNEKKNKFDKTQKEMEKQGVLLYSGYEKGVVSFFKNIYGDRLVMKFVPYEKNSDLKLNAIINREFLREPIDNIIYKYGTYTISEWYVLGKIATVFPKTNNPYKKTVDTKNSIIQENIKIVDQITNTAIEYNQLTDENKDIWNGLGLDEEDFFHLKNHSLENLLEGIFESINVLHHESSTKFPSVTFTPIAIYIQ